MQWGLRFDMRQLKVNLKKRSYSIIIGNDILHTLARHLLKLKIGRYAYVITNAYIKKKYGSLLKKALSSKGINIRFKTVADSEKSKSLEISSEIIRDMVKFDRKKKFFIVAFGGGVIGDLSGFVASIYKRGVPYIQIPTTLLAQVDSSIGGKTAVDLPTGKNLVGAFYQPKLVFSELMFLKTLSRRQIQAGLAEVIKYGIIKDPKLFVYLERKNKGLLKLQPSALEYIVASCSKIKASIVTLDEREEKGLRTILNFGHTIGHAIEAASKYDAYNHGEAIALGMLAAVDISRSFKFIGRDLFDRINKLIKSLGLPDKIKNITLNKIINAHYYDKKFVGSKNKFVLIKGLGKTLIVKNVPLAVIKEAIKRRF